MAIKDLDPEKYYPMSRLHPLVREEFFGWCDKKFYNAIKFGVGTAKCQVYRTGGNNSAYRVKGADIVKFLEDVKRVIQMKDVPNNSK